LVVEDHYIQGGLFDAISSALSDTGIQIHSLAVNRIPKSGKPQELFELCGISHNHIVSKVKSILNLWGQSLSNKWNYNIEIIKHLYK